MSLAGWIASQLLAGKSVAHEGGLTAYARLGHGLVTYGVTTAEGLKYDFPTANDAAAFAATLAR